MDAMSPNTSAFLSYLGSTMDVDLSKQNNFLNQPTSLPPSAFFPIPGRDTPEDTPPSSTGDSVSPLIQRKASAVVSADSEEETHMGAMGNKADEGHKRKAVGRETREEEEEVDDSELDSPSGHEEKRQHGGGRRQGRKSGGNEDGQQKGTRDVGKAARRKEQNRAAQKAFRERREAKVKDLEDKLAEVEDKSYGVSVENENLRGILKRLQEENVALKQSAFTFQMPLAGSSGDAPQQEGQRQNSKAVSPPHVGSDEQLQSVKNIPNLVHRSSSLSGQDSADSPQSLVSLRSDSNSPSNAMSSSQIQPPSLLDYNNRQWEVPTAPSQNSGTSRSNTASSLTSESNGNQTEVDALWASIYPSGFKQSSPANVQQFTPAPQQAMASQRGASTPIQMLGPQPPLMSFGQANEKNSFGSSMAYRDSPASVQPLFQPQQSAQVPANPWGDFNSTNVDDFLASLTGDSAAVDNDFGTGADDDFDAQLQQLLEATGSGFSPSAPFALPQNAFSPTAYLNMSPPDLGQSPGSNAASGSTQSNADSPDSSGLAPNIISTDSVGDGLGNGQVSKPHQSIDIVDDEGRVLKPFEVWQSMSGTEQAMNYDSLVIDDLCDKMRAKAVVKDGHLQISHDDARIIHAMRTLPNRLRKDVCPFSEV